MSDIVSNSSVSFDSIKSDLIKYVRGIDDYNVRFKDFYEGGPGVTLVELISGMGAYLNLVALKSRREAYIDEAKLPSSVVGIATTVGYDINRATAPKYSLTIECIQEITVPKETPIGYYNAVPMCLLEDTTFTVGTNVVTVALGTWSNYTRTSGSSNNFSRFLIQDNIDNNIYKLTVNGVLVETVRAAELLANNPNVVLLRTYFTGMYIIFGDGIFGKTINVGDTISFDYFIPAPLLVDSSINLSNITITIGTITSGSVVSYGANRDSDEKIKFVAPGYFAARRRLVVESDYNYIANSYNGIISSNEQKHPGICCTIDLAVLADGARNLIPTEQTAFLNYMNGFQVLGTTINLVPSKRINTSISLTIVVNRQASQTLISDAITKYFNSMTNKLGVLFSVRGILNLEIPNVIGIYYKYPIIDRQAAYNQYFSISSLNLQFTTDATSVGSFGTDPTIGYVVDESN